MADELAGIVEVAAHILEAGAEIARVIYDDYQKTHSEEERAALDAELQRLRAERHGMTDLGDITYRRPPGP